MYLSQGERSLLEIGVVEDEGIGGPGSLETGTFLVASSLKGVESALANKVRRLIGCNRQCIEEAKDTRVWPPESATMS